MVVPFFFLFGLIIGSFLNVVLLRTEKEEALSGRSSCPKCHAMISWYDNIPVVSFFLLGGRCRSCRESISWQYPIIEAVTGCLFAIVGGFVFQLDSPATWLTSVWWCFLFALLLAITVYDVWHMEIPLVFLTTGILGTLLYFLGLSWQAFGVEQFLDLPITTALLGGGATALFFYVLVFVSQERWMGMGDVWLGFLAGMSVGPRAMLFLLTLAFTLGACLSLGLLLSRKKELSSQIPFAPYLSLATVLTLMLLAHPPIWFTLFLFPFIP